MRGESERQATMMLGLTPDGFVPKDHPLRRIKPLADSALRRMSPLFDEIYADNGRPSIPPEHLLKASLLMAFYTVRSERQFCEQLRYNLLFKWFLDLNVEDEPFHPTTFTKNRERLMEADAARVLLKEVVKEARRRRLLSPDHFSVDGTLLDAWASHKSYRPRDEQPRMMVSAAVATRTSRPPTPRLTATPNGTPPWRCSNAASGARPRSAPTVATTRAISSGACAAWG